MSARSTWMVALLVVAAAAGTLASSDVILKPTKTSGSPVGVVMVQGASIPVDRYTPVMQAWQAALPLPLYVAIPTYPLEMPNPLTIGGGIDRAVKELYAAGLPEGSPLFLAGHSLGGAMLGIYTSGGKVPNGTIGQILMGSFVERSNYGKQYPVDTLTLGGELDGLCRCTRIAEAYHNYVDVANAADDFPVIILDGVSHMQFASGTPPALVKARDLVPEVSYAEAHTMIANAASLFMQTRLGATGHMQQSLGAYLALSNLVSKTGTFVKPIIDALLLEGYYSFTPPCYKAKSGQKCTKGSPWISQVAQSVMGGLKDGATIANTDTFESLDNVFKQVHPQIESKCDTPSPSCVLVTTTITELHYNLLHGMDTGFVPISASSMSAEMNSREAIQIHSGLADPGYNTTDAKSLCQQINIAAHEFAEHAAGNRTLARFQAKGEPLSFKPDSQQSIYPTWDAATLSLKQGTSGGTDVLDVQSASLVFKLGFPFYGGQHFCQLLSPARALEWIYVDGLRKHDSLANSTSTHA